MARGQDDAMPLELFLVVAPGLERALCDEAKALGFADPLVRPGGVELRGTWRDVWRANLTLRGATRVLVRIASFRAMHLAQLDKRSRKVDWASVLSPDQTVRVEATCRKSRIYHAGAAKQRIERAIAETIGATVAEDAELTIKARIDDDLCTISVDTSGEALHKRGHKVAVGKAPMRETLAALFLRECGYTGAEPVVDPMCGSGTFVIEAAEIAMGLMPGRDRSFAFERFASFDAGAFAKLKITNPQNTAFTFHGFDRDAGAIKNAMANAERAGVGDVTSFQPQAISELTPPDTAPGLVIVNPPYGARIGNKKMLFALYGTLGKVLTDRFCGWRVGIVTSDAGLAKATNLPFVQPGPPVAFGGLKVTLWRTDPLPA